MQGESFESARKEIGRDHAARTPISPAEWYTAQAITCGLETQLVTLQNLI